MSGEQCSNFPGMEIFNADDIQARRERLAAEWDAILGNDEAVLVHSGEPIQKPGGLDQTYPFLPHPAYFWLTGRRRETEAVLYSRKIGWVEFQKAIPPSEAIWEGEREDLLVEQSGHTVAELKDFLKTNRLSNVYALGQARFEGGKKWDLRTALDQTRRKKDAAEIALIRQLAGIAGKGYEAIRAALRPGVCEIELQLAYETAIARAGAHRVPYDTIIGSGPNAAVLHAIPTGRTVKEGEFLLVDAGADIYDYCVDITRVFPSTDAVSTQHKDLYNIVFRAETECMTMSKPGVWWHDVHLHAARVITEGLLQVGILKGNLQTLLEKEVSALFFPHGVGHLVGLRVRDTGQLEAPGPHRFAGANIRVDLPLEAGHTITVEPGCYFIPALLKSDDARSNFRDDINWTELEKWIGIGGVRIEDNILITESGNENLTATVPKVGW